VSLHFETTRLLRRYPPIPLLASKNITDFGFSTFAVSYLTFFYTKREIALRVGYLFVSAAIAGSIGGLLAYAIGHMQGVGGYSGWRYVKICDNNAFC
jgi:hypothetical protein